MTCKSSHLSWDAITGLLYLPAAEINFRALSLKPPFSDPSTLYLTSPLRKRSHWKYHSSGSISVSDLSFNEAPSTASYNALAASDSSQFIIMPQRQGNHTEEAQSVVKSSCFSFLFLYHPSYLITSLHLVDAHSIRPLLLH